MAHGNRTRNYAAEEARRNARARQLGFSSRAQMRRALAQGWSPQRAAGPRSTIIAPPPDEPARPIARGLRGLARIKAESAQWSRLHSRQPTSRFRARWDAEKIRAYHAAYVDDDTRANKIENDLDSLRDFLVDTMGFYTDAGFDDRYGVTHLTGLVNTYVTPELSDRLGN